MQFITIHPLAKMAIRAVQIRKQCGSYAARRFAEKNGIVHYYRLACQLDAATKAGF